MHSLLRRLTIKTAMRVAMTIGRFEQKPTKGTKASLSSLPLCSLAATTPVPFERVTNDAQERPAVARQRLECARFIAAFVATNDNPIRHLN